MKIKKTNLPILDLRGDVRQNSFDTEKNTIDVVASTGSRVRRDPWFSESYIEELEISSDAIRMERFTSGSAPVLKDHNAMSIDNQLGVIVSSRVDNNQLLATVRLSKREEFSGIIDDIRNGIIKNVSIGYRTYKRQELEERQEDLKIFRSIDWEPYELSFVTIPADAASGTRSQTKDTYECETILREDCMKKKVEKVEIEERKENVDEKIVETGKEEIDLEAVRKDAISKERKRVSEIRAACVQANLSERADDYISVGVSVDFVRKDLLENLAKRDAEMKTSHVQVGNNLSHDGMKRGMENAILNRIDSRKFKLDETGHSYRNMKLIDLVRDSLEFQGVKHRNMAPMELASRAMHSTSDFPEILANVINKTLRDAYEESPQTFAPFTRRVTVSDFKEISRTQLGDAPQLLEKLENGEYQSGSTSEAAEKYSVKEYGRMVPVGRRVIINDDLSAFTRLPGMMGRQARNLESDKVWAEITSNPLMADGNALFSAAHGNLAGTGTAISITSLGVARAAMRVQTSLDGSKLNLRPRFLYVPAALETIADQITTTIIPNTAGDVNPFGQNGRTPLSPVTEPRLDDNSAIAWYLFSDLAEIDMMELATLEGEQGPVIDSMIDFDTDGMKFKVRHTIGVKAIDWRGMYKNPGA